MTRLFRFMAATAIAFCGIAPSHAQDFTLNVVGNTTNFWSNDFLSIPAALANYGLTSAIEQGEEQFFHTASMNFDMFSIKRNGVKVANNNGKFFGFKAKDMFSRVRYGLRAGYMPKNSPVGGYLSVLYQFRRFEADLGVGGATEKFKIHSIRPEFGLRIAPFKGLLEDEGWSPMVEAGIAYNVNLSVKSPYGTEKKQFNNGLSSNYNIGVQLAGNARISAGVELNHYNLFNEDFTPDGVNYPYQGVKTTYYTIQLMYSHGF